MQFSWHNDPFDTEILGFSTAKITEINSPNDVVGLVNALIEGYIEYATYRFSSKRLDIAHALEKNGFLLVDGAINFENSSLETYESKNVREAIIEDIERLKQISGHAFDSTRFFNDPIISNNKAQEIYKRWVENSVSSDVADRVLVFEQNGMIAGYVTIKGEHIPLIAVGKEFQGNGIGKMLVKSALSYIKDSGGDNAKIETQIQNISAIRAYASCGFKAIETYLTFAWSKSSR